MKRIVVILAMLSVTGLLLTGGIWWSRGITRETPHLNVLLIVIDTLRADRLGCYGDRRGLTPSLDEFAARGVRFERAFAHAPWTLPSLASLLTSRYPHQHGAGGALGEFTALAASIPTLAERFADAGYATAAVSNVPFFSATFGLDRGFAHFDLSAQTESNVDTRRADATTDAALRWLGAPRTRSAFLVVHYFDPHLRYDPPADFRRRFADGVDRHNDNPIFGTIAEIVDLRRRGETLDTRTVERLAKLYDGEVAFTDQQVGRLLAGLDDLGLTESTIVVVTSDHGEEFLDHGGFEHGHTHYDELLHVPLIWRIPGRTRATTVRTAVRLVDVGPTLCALSGVPADVAIDGQSLLPLIDGATSGAHRPVLSEGNFWGPAMTAWRAHGYKLIVGPGPEASALYCVADDPGETVDLADRRHDLGEKLREEMRQALGGHHPPPERGLEATLNAPEIQRLRDLGYLPGD